MSGNERERNERQKRADERAPEQRERGRPEPKPAGSGGQGGDAYGCVDWFDYDPEADARKRRVAH